MAHRIEVGLKEEIRDPMGEKVRRRVQNDLGLPVESVRTISVFTLDMELHTEFLHFGLPRMELRAKWKRPVHEEPNFLEAGDLTSTLKEMFSRLNICSKESMIRQYDHEVQGGSVIKPLVGRFNDGPSDAAVLRPILSAFEGIVISKWDLPPI